MNRTILTVTGVLSASSLLLVDSAVKGTVLLALAAVVALFLRRDSAATRHLVWLLAIVAMLVVPVLSAMLPQWRVLPAWMSSPRPDVVAVSPPSIAKSTGGVIESPRMAEPVEVERPIATVDQRVSSLPDPQPALATPEAVPAPAVWSWNWINALPLVWAIGFAVLMLRLSAARWMLWNSERLATVIGRRVAPQLAFESQSDTATAQDPIVTAMAAICSQLGIGHPVTLLIHPHKTIPVVWGILRCRLMLPAAARQWSDEQLQSVLLHELAHIKRRDTIVQLLAQVACALHWFNPLVWFAAWRLDVERERSCDDLVLASGIRPSAYAGHLLDVVTGLSPARWTQACGLAMARKSSLEGRLTAVLGKDLNRRGVSMALAGVALAIAVGIAVPIAMLRAADEKGNPPQVAHISSNDYSTYCVHDGKEASFVIAYRGDFGSATGGWNNPKSRTWQNEATLALLRTAEKREFTLRRDHTAPVKLTLAGKDYDLAKGRVFLLSDDGAVRQIDMKAPVVRDHDAAKKLVALIAAIAPLEREDASMKPKHNDVRGNDESRRFVFPDNPPNEAEIPFRVVFAQIREQMHKASEAKVALGVEEHKILRDQLTKLGADLANTKWKPYVTRRLAILDWQAGQIRATEVASRLVEMANDLAPREKNLTIAMSLVVDLRARDLKRFKQNFSLLEPSGTEQFGWFVFEYSQNLLMGYVHEGASMEQSREGRPVPEEYRRSVEVADFLEPEFFDAVESYIARHKGVAESNATAQILERSQLVSALKQTAEYLRKILGRRLYLDVSERTTDVLLPRCLGLWASATELIKTDGDQLESYNENKKEIDTFHKSIVPHLRQLQKHQRLLKANQNELQPAPPDLATDIAAIPPQEHQDVALTTNLTGKLAPETVAKLKWGEPVNGLRMALAYPPALGDALLGEEPYFQLVVQNVSKKEVHFIASDAAPNPRELNFRADNRTVLVLADKETAKADWHLQAGHCGVLRMFMKEMHGYYGTVSAGIERDLSKIDGNLAVAEMEVAKAPAGAWTGKLVTGQTRGSADVAAAPAPMHKDARSLYEIWLRHARANGDIPGALVGELASGVKQFIKYNPTWVTVPKLNELLPRLDATHDWKPADAIALLDEVAGIQDSPLKGAVEKATRSSIRQGEVLPKKYAKVRWGDLLRGGTAPLQALHAAWVLEPDAAEHRLGEAVKARLLVGNQWPVPFMVQVPTFHQGGVKATDAKGAEVEVSGISWTTLAQLVPVRLAPGEYIEINTPGIGFGPRAGMGPWAGPRVGSNVLAKAGDELTLTHGLVPLDGSEVGVSEDDPHVSGPGWWLAHIKARLNRELPLPADAAERTRLLDRAVRELFATAPTAEETAEFIADKTPDALDALAKRLVARVDVVSFSGKLPTAPAKFRVLAADENADKQPRVVLGPGEYPLPSATPRRGDATLKIVGRPVGDRRTNDAQLLFEATEFTGALPPDPHKLEVPDGWGTWAIVCRPDSGVLYLLSKGAVRKIDYTKPRNVSDTLANDLPAEFRDEVKRQFDIHEISAAQQAVVFEKPAPPAATPEAEKQKGAAVKLTLDALLGFWRGTMDGKDLMLSFHRPPVEKDVQLDIYFGRATIGRLARFNIAPDGDSALVVLEGGDNAALGTLRPIDANTMRLEGADKEGKAAAFAMLTRDVEPPATEPRQKEARELFEMWKRTANEDGTIPGTFIGQLATEVRAHVMANPNSDSGMKLPKLLPRFVTSRDWTQAEAIKLLDDLAYYSTQPIVARVAKAKLPSGPLWRTEVEFADIPVQISKWSEAKDGLRVGMRVVDADWRIGLGGGARVELWLHNAGDKDVTFKTTGPDRQDTGVAVAAIDAEGREHWADGVNVLIYAGPMDCKLPAGHVALAKKFKVTFAEPGSHEKTWLTPRFHGLKHGKYQLRCKWMDAYPDISKPGEWKGELTAPDHAFTLAAALTAADLKAKPAPKLAKLPLAAAVAAPQAAETPKTTEQEAFTAWGNEISGLQAGLGFKAGEKRVYTHGETATLVVRVRNVGQNDIKFKYYPTFLSENSPTVLDETGKRVSLRGNTLRLVKHDVPKEVNLAVGKEIELHERELRLASGNEDAGELKTRDIFPTGKFLIQHEQVIGNSAQASDKLDPTLEKLATGKLEFEVREPFTAWGKEVGGLQAGLGFKAGEKRAYTHGEWATLVVRVRNVGKEEVKFQYLRQFFVEQPPTVFNEKGELKQLGRIDAFGEHIPVEVKLAAGKEIELYELKLYLGTGSEEGIPKYPYIFGTGKFQVQYEKVLGNSSSGSIKLDPALSKLATGKLELEIKPAAPLQQEAPKPGAQLKPNTELKQNDEAKTKLGDLNLECNWEGEKDGVKVQLVFQWISEHQQARWEVEQRRSDIAADMSVVIEPNGSEAKLVFRKGLEGEAIQGRLTPSVNGTLRLEIFPNPNVKDPGYPSVKDLVLKRTAQRGAKVRPITEQKLKWGEPVNGLRMALAWPPTLGEAAMGDAPEFCLVVQNVSQAAVRLTTGTAAPNPRRLNLMRRLNPNDETILSSRTVDDVPVPGDWLLQPRESALIRLIHSDEKMKDGQTFSAVKEHIVSVQPQYSYTADMTIEKAPAGAWTGKLTTGETRGSADVPPPKSGVPLAEQTWPMPPWGAEKDGLSAGIRIIGEARIGGEVKAELWVRNSGAKDVTFSHCPRADFGLHVVSQDKDGKEHSADVTQFRGYPVLTRLLLPAGNIVKLKEFTMKLGAKKDGERVNLDLPPGEYKLRAVWSDTTSRVAPEGEWTGKLTTGEVDFKLAAAKAGADAGKPAAKPPGANMAKLPDDQYVMSGFPADELVGEGVMWNDVQNGLSLGYRITGDEWRIFGKEVKVELWVRNPGDKDVKFQSLARPDIGLRMKLKDETGVKGAKEFEHESNIVPNDRPPYGELRLLPPGHAFKVKEFTVSLLWPENDVSGIKGHFFTIEPGAYKFHCELELPGFSATGEGGKQLTPAAGEWTGKLTTRGLNVVVVAPDAPAPKPRIEHMDVDISKDGEVSLFRIRMPLEELKTRAAKNAKKWFTIRANKDVPYAKVVEVVEALKAVGVSEFSFAEARVGDGKYRVANRTSANKLDDKHGFSMCRPSDYPQWFTVSWPEEGERPACWLRTYPNVSKQTEGKWAVVWEPGTNVLWWVDDSDVGKMTVTDPAHVIVDREGRTNNFSRDFGLPEDVKTEFRRLGFVIGRDKTPGLEATIGGNTGGQSIVSAEVGAWSIKGTVTDADGKPLADVSVRLTTNQVLKTEKTNAKGEYYAAFSLPLQLLAHWRGVTVEPMLEGFTERDMAKSGEFNVLLRAGEEPQHVRLAGDKDFQPGPIPRFAERDLLPSQRGASPGKPGRADFVMLKAAK